MPQRTFSEQLFEEFCESNGPPCMAVPVGPHRTPDYDCRCVLASIELIGRNVQIFNRCH
jgi:hypothetical protein